MKLSDIYRHATETPSHLAIVDNGIEYTYRQFAAMIEISRQYLVHFPADEGQIVLVMGSHTERWILNIALRSLGHTTISASSWEVLDGLRLHNLSAIAAFDATYANLGYDPASERNIRVFRVPAQILAHSDAVSPKEVGTNHLSGNHIVFTSGTTGNYKKLLYHSSGFLNAPILVDLKPHDVFHSLWFGPWTVVGAKFPQRAWQVGATVIFDNREDWADHFFDYPVSNVCFVGRFIEELCGSRAYQPDHYPELEVIIGGGPANASSALKLLNRFRCRPIVKYGGTEFTSPLESVIETKDDLVWLRPISDNTLEIVDYQDNPVSDNVEGIIRVKLHPWEPPGYFDEPEATAEYYRDGYFYPGDLAIRREDGRVRIVGRVKDVIIINGEKVAVGPHEEHACSILGVECTCLFARQADSGEKYLLVVVESKQLPPRERLQALARDYASAFGKTEFVALAKFPRGENGMAKIDRQAVLRLAQASIPTEPRAFSS